MSGSLRLLAAASVLLLLAGCASRGPAVQPAPTLDPAIAAEAAVRQAQREAWLSAHPAWGFQGRVAVSQAGKGGSGRLDWQQQAERYTAQLSAPVTRQSWRMSADGDGALLEGLAGGPRQGGDADTLLREATGWEIPVQTLAQWARGMTAGSRAEYGADGQLLRMDQAGWRIVYTEWQPATANEPALPKRVEAERGQAKVRLIVDTWDFGSP